MPRLAVRLADWTLEAIDAAAGRPRQRRPEAIINRSDAVRDPLADAIRRRVP